MPQLSSEGRRAVEDVARRMGFSPDAVTSMLFSIVAGRGGMAQFNHPEFGGSGQWMSGGAIMISDMFNNVLKARVNALCNELSALIRDEHGIPFQSQSQGKPAELNARLSSLLAPETPRRSNWWPSDLGSPSSVGAQNDVRYAYFPAERRLVVDLKGKVTVYDTQDHQTAGFSQQQPGSGSLNFASQLGPVDVGRLPVVSGADEARAPSEPTHRPSAQPNAVVGDAGSWQRDILTAIERLGELQARGILTDAEFSAKKAELLGRL
jgi:hypothetical protein